MRWLLFALVACGGQQYEPCPPAVCVGATAIFYISSPIKGDEGAAWYECDCAGGPLAGGNSLLVRYEQVSCDVVKKEWADYCPSP